MGTTKMTAPVRSWLLVADSKDTVLISTGTDEMVKVRAQDAADAAPDASADFHEMTRRIPFSLYGVSSPQKVYVQSGCPVPVEISVTAV